MGPLIVVPRRVRRAELTRVREDDAGVEVLANAGDTWHLTDGLHNGEGHHLCVPARRVRLELHQLAALIAREGFKLPAVARDLGARTDRPPLAARDLVTSEIRRGESCRLGPAFVKRIVGTVSSDD